MATPYACFGKLPALGDFIAHGMETGLQQRWDHHLSNWMLNGQQCRGSDWIETYLSMPVFSFRSGSISELSMKGQHCAGILMPSVDKSGRFFPFVLMATVEPPGSIFKSTTSQAEWLFQLRRICSAALYEDWSLVQLNKRLEQLNTPHLAANETLNPAQCLWQTIDQHGVLDHSHTCDGFPDWAYFKDVAGMVYP